MRGVRCAVTIFFVVLMISCCASAEEFMTDSGEIVDDMGNGDYMTDSGEVKEKGSSGDYILDDGEMESSYGVGGETTGLDDIGQTQDGIGCTDNDKFGEGDLSRLGE